MIRSSCRRASPMSRSRCRGSRIRQSRTSAEAAPGCSTAARRWGLPASTPPPAFPTMSSESNARVHVSISNSTQPNAQISTRLSIGLPFACSGAMYTAVPSTMPICVIAGEVRVGEFMTVAGSRGRLVVDGLGQAEVQHLDGAVGANLDVCWLEIAVNDPALVRRLQRVGDLTRDRQHVIQRASRLARGARRGPPPPPAP